MEITKQRNIKDCGITIVKAFYEYFYDKELNYNAIKVAANFGSQGINIYNLAKLCEQFNLKAISYKITFKELWKSKYSKHFCTIIDSNNSNHYVIAKINDRKIEINDPAKGFYRLSKKEFEKIFKNIFIEIKKAKYVKKIIIKSNDLFDLSRSYFKYYFLIFGFYLINLILTFMSGFYLKIILDKIYSNKLENFLLLILILFIYLHLIKGIMVLIKSIISKKVALEMTNTLYKKYVNHLRKCNVKKMNILSTSEIIKRMTLIKQVSSFLTNYIVVISSQTFCFFVSGILLLFISSKLFLIVLIVMLIKISLSFLNQYFIKNQYDGLLKSQLKILTTSFDEVYLRNNRFYYEQKNQIFNHEKRYYQNIANEYQLWNKNNFFNALEAIISNLLPLIIIYYGVRISFENKLTLGVMLMFLNFLVYFDSSIENIFDFIITYPINIKHKQLLEEFFMIEKEKNNPQGLLKTTIKDVLIQNLSFGYDVTLFKIKHLLIDKDIQIIGKNGSGKTSFLKILATVFIEKENMFFNRRKIGHYQLKALRKRIFFYHPNIYFSYGNVFEFITLNQPNAIKRFQNYFLQYNLQKLFNDLKIDLYYPILNNGMNLSSGQKQIVFLMRLFAFEFDLIILDEAFENIDQQKFHWFKNSLKQVQKGLFIEVSHAKNYIGKLNEVNIDGL